jgi:SAM-dependent methyltransferase
VSQNYFDERIAKSYALKWPNLFQPDMIEPVVDFLAALAGTGAALEFGVGTGRIALPLSRRGIRVNGIDLSQAMLAELAATPGGDEVEVVAGNFATARIDATFSLVYLIRNTITNLTTQDEQVECFVNAARHLEPNGCFMIEVFVPELRRLPPGEAWHAFTVTPSHIGFDEYDVANQRLVSHHFWFSGDAVEKLSTPHRYVWPSELDLMARIAGLRLRERWAGWDRQPFTSESRSHVSVWEKPG